MGTRQSGPVVLTAVVSLLLAGCSDVPDTAELSASLLVPEDLDAPFDEAETVETGIVSPPSVYLCEAAGDQPRTASESLDWQASTTLTWGYTLAQEAVLAGDQADVESTFDALSDGLIACTGPQPQARAGVRSRAGWSRSTTRETRA